MLVLFLWLPTAFSDGRVGVLPSMNITGLKYGGAGPNLSLPLAHDWRQFYARCVEKPYDSGPCEASWALAVASAATDRSCMGRRSGYSAARLLSCCGRCGVGCYGGYPWEALKFLVMEGTTTPTCQPMPSMETDHVRALTPFCPFKYCVNSNNKYEQVFAKHAYLVRNIDNEIFTNGPVISYIDLYSDFLNYTGGIYQPRKNLIPISKITVKLLGWGVEKGQRFWIGENTWGTKWGEGGYFRIQRGINAASIEKSVMAPQVMQSARKTL